MAFNSIKPTNNHKIFPFTTPTITAHKNPPTGHALILEIIFDADDVNITGTHQTHNEEEDNEDDDNDGESDDEDDGDSANDSDTSSHHEDNSDGDSEEDEEDDSEEEESDEDKDDDVEVEFDDEFGNDFDEDLEIEFENDNETETEEEDQLVVEFEESNVNSPPPRPPTPSTVPFWFMNEEPDQIRTIFESYAVTLDLEKQRKACIRSPSPFIGRIKRTPIKPAESDTDKSFKTLDKVEVYVRELYPLGTKLPLSRVAWVLTTWDDDGIPIQSSEMPKSTKRSPLTFHLESMQKRTHGAQSSILYCTPIFRTKDDYQYTVSSQEHSLMYTSNSSTNASISRISPFLPERCRTISFSLD